MKKFIRNKKGKIITGAIFTVGILLFISIPVTAKVQNRLDHPEVVNEQNRDMIGKETFDNYVLKFQDGRYIDSNGITYSEADLNKEKQRTIPNNPIVKEIKLENFIPSSIVEFEAEEKNGYFISPEIITINGSLSVLTKTNGEGWDFKPGEKLSIRFKKYNSEVVTHQNLMIGVIKDGILNKGEIFDKLERKYELTISDPGTYYIYLLNASSDTITLKNGEVIISQ
ncbi:hypothetical protein [Paenibacillus sp. OAE614]|uniref:hypothetical protein n=1 Tax=Paenibacillus sp. OAE614 TaxID=2663804 RepID=UPI00178BFA59